MKIADLSRYSQEFREKVRDEVSKMEKTSHFNVIGSI